MTSRALHEPLLHFVVIGAALFGVWLWTGASGRSDSPTRIELTRDDLRQLSLAWLAQGQPEPSPEQMAALVEGRVREEVLYREALALGFDRNDTIVRRRLAQKMEFLTEDLAKLRAPATREELEAWYQANAQRFARPALISFRHLYFSPDRHGAGTRDVAARALASLAGKPVGASAASDSFMFQEFYGDRAPDEIARDFGAGFARDLFASPEGSWQGPIESGFGWHLVFVDALTPARVPLFDEVEPQVQEAWTAEQRELLKAAAYDEMRKRYVVVLPPSESGKP
jgi:peptidyl-prolyl cis-trans isomerase C